MNSSYTQRLAKLYEKKQLPFQIHKGVFWYVYNKMIVARHPMSDPITLSQSDTKFLLKNLNGYLVRWTGNLAWDRQPASDDWYALLCKKNIDLQQISSNHRKKLKKAIKNCEVKRIDISYAAEHCFAVFQKAHQKYKGVNKAPSSEQLFKEDILLEKDFDELIHYFGVFFSGKLIAYSKAYVFGNEEANLAVSKFDPAFLKYRPSEALAYYRNQYYLDQQKVRYVCSGLRNLEHQTNIQDFYTEKFNFQKVPLPLYLRYKQSLQLPMQILRPFSRIVKRFDPRLSALLALDSIAQKK